ncbi:hypothetical protein Y032_0303g1895 [Ancylostoma ceylanicum]|uniref:Uncharacterized protein n=1 Tax=Ancylostoma ceylanicum TaxID=53326 RepID=A0A016S3G8_9BILA|nr:hypothetical protein Y032_0303g1895 [Ancylostoma ceylanicum]
MARGIERRDGQPANREVYLEASNKHMRNTTLHTLALCVGSIRKRERRSDMELPAAGAWATPTLAEPT